VSSVIYCYIVVNTDWTPHAINMAILSKEINQVEVRIRRHPENTYFDEYIKVGDREKTDATSCDRYIIPELGEMYTIEVTLRRGYNFGNSKSVSAALFLPGVARPISRTVIWPPKDYENFTDEDIKIELTYAERVKVNGLDISGARLAFRGVSIGIILASLSFKGFC
jgi:hypothetical protein